MKMLHSYNEVIWLFRCIQYDMSLKFKRIEIWVFRRESQISKDTFVVFIFSLIRVKKDVQNVYKLTIMNLLIEFVRC